MSSHVPSEVGLDHIESRGGAFYEYLLFVESEKGRQN